MGRGKRGTGKAGTQNELKEKEDSRKFFEMMYIDVRGRSMTRVLSVLCKSGSVGPTGLITTTVCHATCPVLVEPVYTFRPR